MINNINGGEKERGRALVLKKYSVETTRQEAIYQKLRFKWKQKFNAVNSKSEKIDNT